MNKGILIFAENNERIDYGLQATIAAKLANTHMQVPVTLIANKETIESTDCSCFESVIEIEKSHLVSNRQYRDGKSHKESLTWRNSARNLAFELTPYDETIVIDSDYLIQDNSLNNLWGSSNIHMNKDICMPSGQPTPRDDLFINDKTLRMFWATVFYFQKNELSEHFFTILNEIKKNYEVFRKMFGFSGKLYRNDYAFTIAAHLSSNQEPTSIVQPLPVEKTMTCYDYDDLIDIEFGSISVLSYNLKSFKETKIGNNIHFMNKFAIQRKAKEFFEIYS